MVTPRRFLPSVPSLQALEAVARLGSATAAAEELSLTQGAVSRQLKSLEDQLGAVLFNRTGKRLVLTQAGEAYVTEIRAALHQIAQASLKLQTNPGGGAVNLAILPTFGMRWLVPRLPQFASAHPDVTINMATRMEPFNFATQPFDAAITFGNGDWPDCQKLWLSTENVIPVALPDLLCDHPVTSGHDLLKLPLLHIQHRPRAWQKWFAVNGVETGPLPGMTYDQFPTIVQAALHGLGVALLPDFLVAQELAEGRLEIALDGPEQSLGDYWLVWPDTRRNDPALSAFRDWLAEIVGDEDLLPR
ncbi:LysR substrate-binding domain-containing protein [Alisedimentitalea sp. MJ-SS2]|uniref:LysR substrate-binding domain-containing protein n=1 Tax=Aliisedimentitalea sp. MJ-SS2 TaxID=3049795 RepID=UPI0029100B46|nr:LysR substrate-binding domain-containing protein [Alisedimentitalea sp. MJ-SS2]MDU8926935.1 LysR substrate-binding domain-containing protein [Alisedimentitalea sp. MJ-SS2]